MSMCRSSGSRRRSASPPPPIPHRLRTSPLMWASRRASAPNGARFHQLGLSLGESSKLLCARDSKYALQLQRSPACTGRATQPRFPSILRSPWAKRHRPMSTGATPSKMSPKAPASPARASGNCPPACAPFSRASSVSNSLTAATFTSARCPASRIFGLQLRPAHLGLLLSTRLPHCRFRRWLGTVLRPPHPSAIARCVALGLADVFKAPRCVARSHVPHSPSFCLLSDVLLTAALSSHCAPATHASRPSSPSKPFLAQPRRISARPSLTLSAPPF